MKELIAAKNTELLNLVTDKLTDIIKSGTIGDYYLKELFDKAITSDEPQIAKLIATALVGKIGISYVNTIIKYAVDTNDNALLEEIISTYGDTLYSSDIKVIIKHAIAGDNKVLELVWDKFANQIDGYDAKQLILKFIEKKCKIYYKEMPASQFQKELTKLEGLLSSLNKKNKGSKT